MSDKNSPKPETEKYLFSDSERAFVHRRMAQIDTLGAEVRGVMNFVIEREKLQGAWDMNPDKSGLIKIQPNA